nr:MAG TPA: Thaumarchaeal output domain 1 [Caudoviricetes sp.]
MKKACLICGEEFDCRNQAKICPVCRASGKRICGHCGKVFVTMSKTRYVCKDCDAVRAEKSRRVKQSDAVCKEENTRTRQCVVCARMFDVVGQEKMCPSCREYEQEKRDTSEKALRRPHNPQTLAEMAKAARALGVSYGQYSAMKRGLLKL